MVGWFWNNLNTSLHATKLGQPYDLQSLLVIISKLTAS